MLKLFGKIFGVNTEPIRLQLNENVVRNSKKINYINDTNNINIKNREILIDWLITVVFKVSKSVFKDDVIDTTVNLIDRYLADPNVTIDRIHLQLVGIACLSIANKFWEHIQDTFTEKQLVYITDGAYTVPELIRMERKVLKILDFKIWNYSTHFYLDRYKEHLNLSIPPETENLTKYALLCHEMIQYDPSEIAASIIYSTNNEKTLQLVEISGSCQNKLEVIANVLLNYREEILMKNEFTAIKEIEIK